MPKAISTIKNDIAIDVLRAIQDIGYAIVCMPVLDPDRLKQKRQQQTGWNPILPTNLTNDKFKYRNHNNNGKRFQKKITLNQADTSVLRQWLKKNNLHQHYLTNIALLQSMAGCTITCKIIFLSLLFYLLHHAILFRLLCPCTPLHSITCSYFPSLSFLSLNFHR